MPDTPPSPGGYLLLANAEAGSAEHSAIGDALAVLARDAPTEVSFTADSDDIDAALGRLGSRRLIVAGGDGTCHLVLNRLDELGLLDSPDRPPVGLIPLGTGNDLARGLGLPLDPAEAARRIVDGRPRPAPVLRLSSGEIALNNAHVGVGVDAARRGQQLKPRLGRFAYTVGALLASIDPPVHDVHVEMDGTTVHSGPAILVLVAIGPSAGGGQILDRDLDPRSPEAEVFVIPAISPGRRLLLIRGLATGRLHSAPDVVTRRGREVVLTAPGGIRAEVDGEFRTWTDTTTLAVDPDRWHIIH